VCILSFFVPKSRKKSLPLPTKSAKNQKCVTPCACARENHPTKIVKTMKLTTKLLLILTLTVPTVVSAQSKIDATEKGLSTVVIDAGHGGTDPGAVYQGRQEKVDTLRLAFSVGELVSKVDSMKYTRTTDANTPLTTRRDRAHADGSGRYFVSIHRNAGGGTGVEGQLFNVDLSVSEGHKEEIKYVHTERD
jgi:N-acetylmuramoyl-L-alanine amidase